MRRTLFSDLPRSSDAPSEPAPASGVEEASTDFGRWLTYDLRAKGSPSQVPIVERPSQLPAVVIPVPEQAELANWLLQDLRPRNSTPPDAGVGRESLLPLNSSLESLSSESLSSESLSSESLSSESLSSESLSLESLSLESLSLESPSADYGLLPPDSLVPHAVSGAPMALSGGIEPALDDDDLAVLPSRRGKRQERSRRRGLLLLAALLGVAGLSFWLRAGGHAEATSGMEAAASAPVAAAPLPPPPPVLPEEPEQEAVLPAPSATGHHSGGGVAPAVGEDDEEALLRGRRAGDAVARFADLPLATQSKLAREERQKARAHDASARARKGSSSPRP